MTDNHTFSKHDPDSYRADPLFSIDRRHAALTINPHNSHVKDVTDEPGQWEMVAEQAGAQILSSAFPHSNLALQARAALIRSAMRGDGRARFR